MENPGTWQKLGQGGKSWRRGSQKSGKDTGQRDWEYAEMKFAYLANTKSYNAALQSFLSTSPREKTVP